MWTLPPDITERLRTETVDLDPEHVEVGNGAQDFQIAFGLGIEIEVEQDVDVGSGAVTDGFQMHAQVTQHLAVDIDLGLEGGAETRPPARGPARIVSEDVGLQCGKFLLADLASDRLDAIEIGDRRLVPDGMIDAPGRAMRPVDANAVADFATEQVVAGHAEHLPLDVEQGIFDRANRLGDDATGSGAGCRKELGIDSFVLESVLPDHARRQALDHGTDAGRAEAFVEFAPADDAVIGGDLDEMVVPPAGVAGEDVNAAYFRYLRHGASPGFADR